MFELQTKILSLIIFHILIVLAKESGDAQVSKLPELTSEQLEEAKKFYKSINDNAEHEDKPLQASATGQTKISLSGGIRFADDLFSSFFPVGDKYGGIPDTILGLGKYCVEFAIKGLSIIAYTAVRYPHKFLLKAMIAIGALAWATTNIAYCLSPTTIANFVAKAKIANRNHDEMARINEEWKVRLANTVDRLHDAQEVQKHGCCAWLEYKRKMVEAAPDEAKEFIASWFASFFKMHQVIFCQQYTDGTPECESVEYIDDEPIRMLPRSMITLCMELMVKFM